MNLRQEKKITFSQKYSSHYVNSTGWTQVQHGVYIDADLENSPLEIKTDSSLGSDERVYLDLRTSEQSDAGDVILYFTSTPQYQLRYCTTSRTDFPTKLPTDTNKVWKVSLTRTSDIRLVIHCNEVEVLNILMSDSTCSSSSWNKYWSRDVKEIFFSSSDTASDYYTEVISRRHVPRPCNIM